MARPTLIYDERCAFCRRWVERLKHWDRHDAIAMLPLQDDRASALAGRSPAELQLAVHLVRPDGAVFSGAAAVREVGRYLPGGRWVRLALTIPGVLPLAERAYAWIARTWGPVR